MVQGGRSPSPPRNWGLVVETPYYLQVAPFPKKLSCTKSILVGEGAMFLKVLRSGFPCLHLGSALLPPAPVGFHLLQAKRCAS